MEVVSKLVEPEGLGGRGNPIAQSDLVDRMDRWPSRRRDPHAKLSDLVGTALFRQNVVLRDRRRGRSARIWRVYFTVGLAIDLLLTGETETSAAWRGELCRAHGLTWLPFPKGEKLNVKMVRERIHEATQKARAA